MYSNDDDHLHKRHVKDVLVNNSETSGWFFKCGNVDAVCAQPTCSSSYSRLTSPKELAWWFSDKYDCVEYWKGEDVTKEMSGPSIPAFTVE